MSQTPKFHKICCAIHPGKEVKYFNAQSQQLICEDCIPLNHDNIKSIYSADLEQIKAHSSKLKQELQTLKSKVESSIQNLDLITNLKSDLSSKLVIENFKQAEEILTSPSIESFE